MAGAPCRAPGRRSAVPPYGGGLDYVPFPGSMRPPRRARVSCHQWWVVVVVSLGSSAPFQAALRSGMGSESHLPRAPGVGCGSLKGALSCLLANVAPEIGPRWMCLCEAERLADRGKLGPLGVWGSVLSGSTRRKGLTLRWWIRPPSERWRHPHRGSRSISGIPRQDSQPDALGKSLMGAGS